MLNVSKTVSNGAHLNKGYPGDRMQINGIELRLIRQIVGESPSKPAA